MAMFILLGGGNFFARQLAGADRVVPLDSGGDLAIGNAFHLERVKFAESGDLIEGQRSIFDEPDGGGFGHQRRIAHDFKVSWRAKKVDSSNFERPCRSKLPPRVHFLPKTGK